MRVLKRRTFLQGIGVAAVAATGLSVRDANAQQVPWSSGTNLPKLKMPADACDCHHHIYDSKYPIAPSATLKPGDAKVADYRALQKRIGTARNVVVQPSTYGTDNSCTLDMATAAGKMRARAVAVVDDSFSDSQLSEMNDRGVRGIRVNALTPAGMPLDQIQMLAKRIAPLGWHMQFWISGPQMIALAEGGVGLNSLST